jgi:hypothetical protein
MRYRVTFTVPAGASAQLASTLIRGQEIEADSVQLDESGILSLWKDGPPGTDGSLIVAYASGAWRTCAEVGAFEAALVTNATTPEKRNENTGRGPTARQSQAI